MGTQPRFLWANTMDDDGMSTSHAAQPCTSVCCTMIHITVNAQQGWVPTDKAFQCLHLVLILLSVVGARDSFVAQMYQSRTTQANRVIFQAGSIL
jgi:hypothetical protein